MSILGLLIDHEQEVSYRNIVTPPQTAAMSFSSLEDNPLEAETPSI